MKILFVYSDPNCSCTVKNIFELSDGFKKIGANISVEYYLRIEENHFKNYDVIMMHRFGGNGANIDDHYINKLEFFIKKYSGSVLTVYHIDDLLLNETIQKFLKMVDLVLVPNQHYVPYYNPFNENFEFINQTFIDTEKFNNIKESDSSKMDSNKFNIVWASTGLVGKSFMRKLIPEINKRFQDSVNLHVIGSGSLEFRDKNIKCYPNLPFDSFINFLKKSDLCLNPISFDTLKFRNVKTEDFINCKSEIKYCLASVCKTPIISGKSYCYSKTIINDYNGIILDNNINDWITAIEKIKSDKNYSNYIVENAYRDCLENFTIVNVAKIVKKIFEKNYKKILTDEYKKNKDYNLINVKVDKKYTLLDQYYLTGDSVLGEISAFRKINQEFIVRNDNLCRIQLRCATYGRTNSGFWKVSIMTKFNEISSILRSVEIDTSKLIDSDWVNIDFEPIPESKNKKYFIQIQGLNCTMGASATLYYDPSSNYLGGSLYLNKSKISGNLSFKSYCKLNT